MMTYENMPPKGKENIDMLVSAVAGCPSTLRDDALHNVEGALIEAFGAAQATDVMAVLRGRLASVPHREDFELFAQQCAVN